MVGDVFVEMKHMRVKTWTQMLTPTVLPSAWRRWEAEGFGGVNWTKVCKIPYECCFSTKLQALQYRVLHRFVPTQKFLHYRRIAESPDCVCCGERDTLVHFIFECAAIHKLWNDVQQYLNGKMFGRCGPLTLKDVVFGRERGPNIINLVILVCKQFIYQFKMQGKYDINIHGFMNMLHTQFAAERAVALRSGQLGRHNKKWFCLLNGEGHMF